MRWSLALFTLAVVGASSPAWGQASTPWRPQDPTRPAWSPRPASTAEAHRFEMERLRTTADRNQDAARTSAEAARRAAADLAARRAPVPVPPVATREVPSTPQPLPPPARNSPTEAIDAWLDRRPH